MIIKCNCKHVHQDEIHGANNRVHNYARSANNKTGGWRCTVCGSIKSKQATANEKAGQKD